MAEARNPAPKPARAAFAATVEQRIWSVIRARHALGKRLTLPDVAFDTKANEGTVRFYFERLVAAGYLKAAASRPRSKVSGGQFTYTRYRLVRDTGLEAPRLRRDGTLATRGLAREQMWRTVKILLGFNALDLSLAASTPQRTVCLTDARQYLGALERGGYVRAYIPAKKGPGGSLAYYRFIPGRNTGPRPPVVRGARAVFDPNLNEYAWQPRKN